MPHLADANQAGLGDRFVAVLDDQCANGTILRLTLYPKHNLVYCGVWIRDQLLLGSSTLPVLTGARGVYTTGRVDLDDNETSVWFVANWEPASVSCKTRCVTAEARLVDSNDCTMMYLGLRTEPETSSLLPLYRPRTTSS